MSKQNLYATVGSGAGLTRAQAAAFVLLGLLLGLLVGWVLWPVEWTDASLDELRPDLQAHYVAAVADAYVASGGQDAATALARLQGFSDPQAAVQRAIEYYQQSNDPGRNIRQLNLRLLATALGAPTEEPPPAASSSPANAVSEGTNWFGWALIVLAGLVLVIGGTMISVRLFSSPSASSLPSAEAPRAATTSGPSFHQTPPAAGGTHSISQPLASPVLPDDGPTPPDSWVTPARPASPGSSASPLAPDPESTGQPAPGSIVFETDPDREDDRGSRVLVARENVHSWTPTSSEDIERVAPIVRSGDIAVSSVSGSSPQTSAQDEQWETGEWDNDLPEDASPDAEPVFRAEDVAVETPAPGFDDPEFPAGETVEEKDDWGGEDLDATATDGAPFTGQVAQSTADTDEPDNLMETVQGVASFFLRGRRKQQELTPMDTFTAIYRAGTRNYDESFTIWKDSDKQVPLGSCGMGSSEDADPDAAHTDRVRVLEVWLYDSKDIRTHRQFIVAPGVDVGGLKDATDNAATVTGEPLVATPGLEFRINGSNLVLVCRLEAVDLLDSGDGKSAFREVQASLSVYTRSSGS